MNIISTGGLIKTGHRRSLTNLHYYWWGC